jgi:hypothetical protein
MKRFQFSLIVAALGLCTQTDRASAQDASLVLVPSKSPIVVQMNGFEKARNKLGKFLGNALPDLAPKLVKEIDDAIGNAAQGRDLKAITKEGRIYLIIPDLSNFLDSPRMAVLVPVTSYMEFKNTFLKADERKNIKKEGDGIESVVVEGKESTLYLAERKEYVCIGTDKETAQTFVKANDGGLDKVLSQETKNAFLKQEVAVYVDIREINKQFGAQIKEFKDVIEMGLGGAGGMIDKKQAEQIKQMFKAFVQIIDDAVAAVIGVEFRDEGVNLKLMAQFGPDTETNGLLKKLKPAALAELGTLPLGQLGYTATNFDTSLSKTLSLLLKESIADDEDPDARKTIEDALKELSENGRAIDLTAGEMIGGVALEISQYKDPAKAVSSQLKMFKAMTKTASFGSVALKNKPEIKEDAESTGGFKFHLVKLTFDFDKAIENLPQEIRDATRASMVKMMGDRSSTWIGTDGKKVIRVSGKNWQVVRPVVEEYLKGNKTIDKDEAFQATRKNLPAEATLIFVADTARLVEMIMEVVREMTAGIPGAFPGGNIPPIKAPMAKPAYLGVALVLKAEYGSIDIYVPTVAVALVRKMIQPLLDKDN